MKMLNVQVYIVYGMILTELCFCMELPATVAVSTPHITWVMKHLRHLISATGAKSNQGHMHLYATLVMR